MDTQTAEAIAAQGLVWLCAQEELLPVFLTASGTDADGLRAALADTDPAVLAAALDFIMMRDATVLDCAHALDLAPERLAMAHAVMAGQAGMHWT